MMGPYDHQDNFVCYYISYSIVHPQITSLGIWWEYGSKGGGQNVV